MGSPGKRKKTWKGPARPGPPRGHLRAVMDGIDQGYVLLDPAGRFVEVNEAFCRITGLRREEVTGHTVEHFVSPEHVGSWKSAVAVVLAPSAEGAFDAVLPLGGRGPRPVRVEYRVLPGEPFFRKGWRWVLITDLSGRLSSDRGDGGREDRRRRALEGVSVGTWEWHLPSGHVVFDEEFVHMLDLLPGALLSDLAAAKALVWDEDLPGLARRLRRILGGRSDRFDLELRLRHSRGSPVWVLGRGRVTERDSKGRPLRVGGSAVDVSRRKRAERALEESVRSFRAILDGFTDRILHLDGHLRILWANEAVRRPFPGCVGERCHEALFRSPEPCEGCPCVEALRSGQLERRVFHGAAEGAREGYWEVWGIPIKDPRGGVTEIVSVGRDITEQSELERGLREARDRAEEASRAKGAFLANMSHELRTPMNAIIGMTDLLLETPLTREQRDLLSSVRSSAGSLMEIISDLLDFSRIEAGRFELSQELFSVRDLCVQVVWTLDVAALRKGLILEHREEGPVPDRVWGDPLRLRQILVNIIGNALKFTDRGRITFTGRGREREGGKAEIFFEVRDTGVGISEEKKPLIFRPFFQADLSSRKRFQGTGLGLAISRQIVEAMGGTLAFESSEGHGSTFFFTVVFPLVTPPQVVAPSLPLAPSRRILVVEDDPMQALILRRLLERRGWKADVVATGEDANRCFREEAYDAVILEGHLSDGSGAEVARGLREIEEGSFRRPFLVLGQEPEGELDAGVEKPIDPEALVGLLEKLVGSSRGGGGGEAGFGPG